MKNPNKAPIEVLFQHIEELSALESFLHRLEQTNTQAIDQRAWQKAYKTIAQLKAPANRELSCREQPYTTTNK